MEVVPPRETNLENGSSGGGLTSDILRARALEYYNNCQPPRFQLHKSGSTTQLSGYLNGSPMKYSSSPDGGSRIRSRPHSFLPLNGRNERPQRTHSERTNRPPTVPRQEPLINSYYGSPTTGKVGLYRSNSSLNLDHNEETNGSKGVLRRDYGSASSLDVISNTNGESFFAMLRGFSTGPVDQRSPGPPKIQDYLRGKIDPLPSTQNASNALANGSDSLEDAQSPRLKTKFHKLWEMKDRSSKTRSKLLGNSEPSLFRKLRGGRSEIPHEPSNKITEAVDPEVRLEEKLRRKAFAHYDCQSISANLSYATRLRNLLSRRRNTTTGASAASKGSCEDLNPEETDLGDNRNSEQVLSCPFFRNELGGEEERMVSLNRVTCKKQQNRDGPSKCPPTLHRPILACGLNLLENNTTRWAQLLCPYYHKLSYSIENVDIGAHYYRQYFYNQEHQNWFGVDEHLGPLALSIKREKLDLPTPTNKFQYRIIIRTSELSVLRGTVLEEAVPSLVRSSPLRSSHAAREVFEYIAPELQLPNFKLGMSGTATEDQLIKLDEQCLNKAYKVGIMYCKAGQSTEEEMYNNEHSGPAFEEFLEILGTRIRLQGFEGYRGGLDNKTDTTGLYSLYARHQGCELMFHVATLLPHTPNNRQQLLRKRHIGNDIVTVVFQEPGALPFTPRTVRSHFQHVFIIIRTHNPCSENAKYSVAISRSKEVPVFGPPIPEGGIFTKSKVFTEFLLSKIINAENAAHRSEKFATMAQRTRHEYLKDLAANYTTNTTIDSGPKFSILSFGGGKKKERSRPKFIPHAHVQGAITWQVQVEDFGQAMIVDCLLGISVDTVVLIEDATREVVFACPTSSILGWSSHTSCLKLFHHQGECLLLRTKDPDVDEVQEIVSRFNCVAKGCETQELILRRNSMGQLGFHIQYEGIITEVEHYGFAWQAGLRHGSRLVEICKVAVATLTYDQMVDLLKTSMTVTVTVVPPFQDGSARRGCGLNKCSYLPTGSVGDYENLTTCGNADVHKSHVLHRAPTKKETAPRPNNNGINSKTNPELGSPFKTPRYHPPHYTDRPPLPHASSHGRLVAAHSELSLADFRPPPQHRQAPKSWCSPHKPLLVSTEGYQSDSSSGDWQATTKVVIPSVVCVDERPSETTIEPQKPAFTNSNRTNILNLEQSKLSRLRPGVTSRPPAVSSGGSSCSGSTSTLQEDLLKLISPDFLDSDSEEPPSSHLDSDSHTTQLSSPYSSLERGGTKSTAIEADVILTKAQPAQVISSSPPPPDLLSRDERLSPRVTDPRAVMAKLKPNNPPSLIPLPEGRDIDWPSLVDTATKAIEGLSPNSSQDTEAVSSLESNDLEAHVRKLQHDLAKEQNQKASLENQVRHLRDENRRLQEESDCATAQLNRITEWFFHNLESQ